MTKTSERPFKGKTRDEWREEYRTWSGGFDPEEEFEDDVKFFCDDVKFFCDDRTRTPEGAVKRTPKTGRPDKV